MGWFAVRTVWFKELVDTVRDKRTLIMMVLLPLVLMPLVFLIGPVLMQREAQALTESLPVAVFVGDAGAIKLQQWFSETNALDASHVTELDRSQADKSVRRGDVDLIVYVHAGNDTASEATVPLELVYESRRGKSLNALRRFEGHVQVYSGQIVAERLAQRALSPTLLEPLQVTAVHDLTTDEQIGGRILGMILPFLIAIWAVTGGMYTAIDVAAGEKERGTLESLIMAPVSRGALVVGKFLAVVTVAFTAVSLLIASMLVSILYLMPRLMGEDGLSLQFAMEPLGVMLLLIVMVLFIAMVAALLLALSAFGKSFREGQSYTTGLMIVVMLPGMYFMFVEDVSVAAWVYAVPIFNVMLVLRELLEGMANWAHLGITLASLAVCAGIAMLASFKVFLNERVLFRS